MYKDQLKSNMKVQDLIEFFEQMYDVFLLSSTDGRIYYANRARGLISGVPKENIILNELRTTVTSKVQKYIL